MDRSKELKVHRLRLPGRSLCSIRSNRKWCKRRGSSLQCQNCFFVYTIIDCNLKNFLNSPNLNLPIRQIQIFCCFQSLRKTGIYFNLYSFSNLRCLITINGNGMITPPIINTISNTSTGITNPNQKPSSIHMP